MNKKYDKKSVLFSLSIILLTVVLFFFSLTYQYKSYVKEYNSKINSIVNEDKKSKKDNNLEWTKEVKKVDKKLVLEKEDKTKSIKEVEKDLKKEIEKAKKELDKE